MSTPVEEHPAPRDAAEKKTNDDLSPSDDSTAVQDGLKEASPDLSVDTEQEALLRPPQLSPSQRREHATRLEDDLAVMEAERVASSSQYDPDDDRESHALSSVRRSRSHKSQVVDEFDVATNPLHEKAAAYNPPENPSTNFAKFFIKIHNSSFIIRYFTYIVPVVLILLIPLLVGALAYENANVGGVKLLWFSVWLEIVWLTLWAGRIVAKCIPGPLGLLASLFTNNAKKWRDLGKSLELPATLFFWWLGVEISFLPTMTNHHIDGDRTTRNWERVVNKIIISVFVGTILNFIEKIIIQLIAISFHLRTYSDRIEINKFQIGSLTKLYAYSKQKIAMSDEEFEEHKEKRLSAVKTPLQYAGRAQKVAREALNKVGDVAGAVAGDFTGRKVNKSSDPHQVVLTLLNTTSGSQVLARRLYRTFVREGFDTVFSGDLKAAFDDNDEADAAFAMFDKDMNGDISMEELEAVCVEIGRERKSITASLKDLDSVVSKLDDVLVFIVVVITVLVFLSLISTSAAGVLTSAGSTILALSWLFSATAQEFLQSVVFVFVKHPFDVGDRVSIYGNTGAMLRGDDYFVKEISLLYTEFKKMEGHVVQAPNSYLNTLFILNQRRSGALAEAVPIVIKYGTTLEQIDALRQRLLEFVRSEKREYQPNILTELREVTENYSITLNVVFFYKSNWQNELLRLQRRNKFICMLMVSLQEIGIEGPRMNLQGANVDFPFHVTHHGMPPPYSAATSDNHHPPQTPVGGPSSDLSGIPEENEEPSGTPRHRPSILRKGMNVAAARARRESISSNKHVDFSLGMREVASGDPISDVYWDRRGRGKIDEVVRNVNRENAERRMREAEEAQPRSSLQSPRSPIGSNVDFPQATGGLEGGRMSLDSTSRPSLSSSIHRRRFLNRFGTLSSRDRDRDAQEDLMEQGRYGDHESIHDARRSAEFDRYSSR